MSQPIGHQALDEAPLPIESKQHRCRHADFSHHQRLLLLSSKHIALHIHPLITSRPSARPAFAAMPSNRSTLISPILRSPDPHSHCAALPTITCPDRWNTRCTPRCTRGPRPSHSCRTLQETSAASQEAAATELQVRLAYTDRFANLNTCVGLKR